MSEYLNDKAADKADELLAEVEKNCSNCESYIEKTKDCSADSNVLRAEISNVNQPRCNGTVWSKKTT